ncbi:hypothetical protein F3Y22_tig00117034pilonHSYRG00134 [Hibiscus syriacus]|uniref:Uncharacterized protein n=1 Tax=Hibiscus syriacus TaxID=106335 RepID=A0A6A2WAJ5_HIBSY|nr:hypothetical protein F3Y22_tig00117034pilonHSYRG00134 [Hibiscus syriacus]
MSFPLARHLSSSTLSHLLLFPPRRVAVLVEPILGIVGGYLFLGFKAWLGDSLGCGVETTWKRLIEGKFGIRAVTPEDLKMNAFDNKLICLPSIA